MFSSNINKIFVKKVLKSLFFFSSLSFFPSKYFDLKLRVKDGHELTNFNHLRLERNKKIRIGIICLSVCMCLFASRGVGWKGGAVVERVDCAWIQKAEYDAGGI